MKLFIIHRFRDKKYIQSVLNQIKRKNSLRDIQLVFLDSAGSPEKWKEEALDKMKKAEAVVVFDEASCQESKNAVWEIERAQIFNKKIIKIDRNSENIEAIKEIKSIYNLSDEFEKCFSDEKESPLELYKIMINSSEQLIQRRHDANRFFITLIATLIAGVGFLIKMVPGVEGIHGVFWGFPVLVFIGLLCKSWHNLIDNYGKLNKAKFDVIFRLEKYFGAQIYSAEWVALGKGVRSSKYKSFTQTEKNVPIYFFVTILFIYIGFAIHVLSAGK